MNKFFKISSTIIQIICLAFMLFVTYKLFVVEGLDVLQFFVLLPIFICALAINFLTTTIKLFTSKTKVSKILNSINLILTITMFVIIIPNFI